MLQIVVDFSTTTVMIDEQSEQTWKDEQTKKDKIWIVYLWIMKVIKEYCSSPILISIQKYY